MTTLEERDELRMGLLRDLYELYDDDPHMVLLVDASGQRRGLDTKAVEAAASYLTQRDLASREGGLTRELKLKITTRGQDAVEAAVPGRATARAGSGGRGRDPVCRDLSRERDRWELGVPHRG
jgi:hypothetical protein